MSNTFGSLFRVTTFGESHAKGLGVVLDGCPAGLEIGVRTIQDQLDRRKPGQSKITTPRKESDQVEILSGIFQGRTLGTPIGMVIYNQDQRPGAYEDLKDLYRPGHADYTYDQRYGFRDFRGGGRASNRETAGRVAAGAIAAKMIEELAGMKTLAWVEQVHRICAEIDHETVKFDEVESNIVRCPDEKVASEMIKAIEKAKKDGNSLGGKIRFRVAPVVAGLGAPVFDKLTAEIAKALMSIPATRSVGFGLAGKAIELTGLEHNDAFVLKEGGKAGTLTNNAGGVLGGISNGEPIYGEVTFKPTATLSSLQKTLTTDLTPVEFKARGRHDPCVLPRAVPIVEAMINLVLADHCLRYSVASMARLKKVFS
ncbi:MAG: chorismate synthase [Deltaproteobacteria bacterium]|nr:chorismate synthase [Deltaproteobacteria bacterium]